MTVEPNDTIFNASESGISSSGERSGILSGAIDTDLDVDLYRVELDRGDAISIDIDTVEYDSTLDSALRVFDLDGNELAMSDDNAAPSEVFSLDPYLTFLPDSSGAYYIGVSSYSLDYDPIAGDAETENFYPSTGNYDLELNIIEVTYDDDDPDNTIAEAIDSGVSSVENQSTVINDAIDVEGDVDVYQFQLSQGDTIVLDLDTDLVAELDSALRLFNSDGREIAISDDDLAPEEEVLSYDSYLSFTAETTDNYYLGVSSFSDTDYDPVNGRDNLTDDDLNFTTGEYELAIAIFNTVPGTDESDYLTGTEEADWIDGRDGYDTIFGGEGSDRIFGGADNDRLYGDDGNDLVKGGAGYDLISGGSGDDTLKGEGESDMLYGNGGSDIFVLDGSADRILDFEDNSDRLFLTNGINFSDLSFIDLGYMGTEISVSGETVALIADISADRFTEADFVGPSEM